MENQKNTFYNRAFEAVQYIDQRDYWLQQLSGELKRSVFPYDHKESLEYPRMLETRFRCPGDIASKLMEISGNSDLSLHMILMAGFILLLNKYTLNDDIIVGTPVYAEETVDHLSNKVLVIRQPLQEDSTFKDLLLQVRETIVKASENYAYPIEKLCEQLNLPFIGNQFCLFDAALVLENIQAKSYLQHIPCNIVFSFLRTGSDIGGTVSFNALLYRTAAVERISRHFLQLLSSALFNPGLKLREIEILPGEEKRQLLEEFGRPPVSYPREKTMVELFEARVEKTPDGYAVEFENKRLTYMELNEKANRLARYLKSKGVATGSIVGLMVDRSIEMISGILGILKAGAAYLPINPKFPKNRILSMLDDCRASHLLTVSDFVENHFYTKFRDLNAVKIKPQLTACRAQIKDFDSFPIPDRSLVDYEKYNQYLGQAMFKNCLSIQGTRGCPYNCTYCHKIWPKKHVVRSAENIFEEVHLYYKMGVRRFAFIDDIFNLDVKNSTRFFQLVIEHELDIQIAFPNGVRGDILSKDYIDLMVKAGTTLLAFALETASPRLQKMIGKNLKLDKFRENIDYFCREYPHVILELFTMIGFPSETKEEAMMTLDFIKSLKWLHFPFIFVLKIYPDTDMEILALKNGVSSQAISMSEELLYHELPETLPFDKSFVLQYQSDFLNSYFLSKERLLHVLPYQMKVLTETELAFEYDSYLPMKISSLDELLQFVGISKAELGDAGCRDEDYMFAPGLNVKMSNHFRSITPRETPGEGLKVLLLDLSHLFQETANTFTNIIEPPLGLMYILTYLKQQFGSKVRGKIAKSCIDFNGFAEFKALLEEFKPDVIGIRTLSAFKDFFHRAVAMIRQWGINVPIVTGGPYATSAYRTILQDPNVDLVVLGEGEITFSEVIGKIMENGGQLPDENVLKEINGIAFIPGKAGAKKKMGRDIILLDELNDILSRGPAENPAHGPQADDLAYIIYTSGSTGVPRGVAIDHANVSPLLHWGYHHLGISPRDRVLQNLSYFFDWSVWEIFIALTSGAHLYMAPDEVLLDPERCVSFIDNNDITVLHVTPTQYRYLDDKNRKMTTLKYLFIGAEKLDFELVERSFESVSETCRVFNMYGPTEAAIISAVLEIQRTSYHRFADLSGIPIGRPAANADSYILDKNLRVLPTGIPGMFYIGGDGLARGYINRPERTMEKFIPNPFASPPGSGQLYCTGDLARWLPDGNIEFLGRVDHQVKIRGYRIELGEIESHILKLPGIKEAVVLIKETGTDAADHFETADKHLCAYIVSDGETAVPEIKEKLARDLPDYMIPANIVRIEKIPFTPNGKIDRKALFEYRDMENAKLYKAPGSEIEEKLAELWAEVLGVKKDVIGRDASFFELGGHSLNATTLIAKMNNEFNVRVPLEEIFRTPNIREMAEYINGAGKEISTDTDDNLVLLKKNSAKDKHLFLIHDGTGEVEGYIEFCNKLNGTLNCWGIKADPIEDYTPRNWTIEELAGKYIKMIKKIQPRGAYSIAGWSLGGVIAFEMGRQLEQMGDEVVFLGLIDSPAPPDKLNGHTGKFELQSELDFVRDFIPGRLFKDRIKTVDRYEQIWPTVLEYLKQDNVGIERIRKWVPNELTQIMPNFQQLDARHVIHYLNTFRTFINTRKSYKPFEKVRTQVHYFGASRSRRINKKGWNDFTNKPVLFYTIKGDHLSIFKEPRVSEFARTFERQIPNG